MMVFHYLGLDAALSITLNEAFVDAQAMALGEDVVELWEAARSAARREAERGVNDDDLII
jgi:hypothetical protein